MEKWPCHIAPEPVHSAQVPNNPSTVPTAQLRTWAASSWLELGLLTTVCVLFHHPLAFPEAWDAALFWETFRWCQGKQVLSGLSLLPQAGTVSFLLR